MKTGFVSKWVHLKINYLKIQIKLHGWLKAFLKLLQQKSSRGFRHNHRLSSGEVKEKNSTQKQIYKQDAGGCNIHVHVWNIIVLYPLSDSAVWTESFGKPWQESGISNSIRQ